MKSVWAGQFKYHPESYVVGAFRYKASMLRCAPTSFVQAAEAVAAAAGVNGAAVVRRPADERTIVLDF